MSFRKVMQGVTPPNQFQTIAVRYLQRVTGKYGPIHYTETKVSAQAGNRNGTVFMKFPNPDSAARLYLMLHEVAHVLLGHTDRLKEMPYNRAEFEAEQQAQKWMDDEGVYVPRFVRQDARRSVRVAIQLDKRAGEPIDPQAVAFAAERISR